MSADDLKIQRVVVTGGRDFTDGARIDAHLRALLPFGLRRLAEGQCPHGGADALAFDVWSNSAFDGEGVRYPMTRSLDGSGGGAYLRRNIRMIEAEMPDLVLAYPDPQSRGTWHCVGAALSLGITVAAWLPIGWRPAKRPPYFDDPHYRRHVVDSGICVTTDGDRLAIFCMHAALEDAAVIKSVLTVPVREA